MNETTITPTNLSNEPTTSLFKRILFAWLLILFALGLAGWVGDWIEEVSEISGKLRYGIQAIIMSCIVVPGIWWMRTSRDQRSFESLGMQAFRPVLKFLGLGLGLIGIPLVLTAVLTVLFGWGQMQLNSGSVSFSAVLVGALTVFFFEALPEELVFRGYIYRNLNTRHKRWLASLMTVGLFVLLPVILVQIQQYVLGMEVRVGGSSGLTASYVITMTFFAAFVQYLRILTKSVWTGIGFHFAFVYFDRIMGPNATDFIQFTDISNEAPIQIVTISALLIIFVGLLIYPRLTKRSLGWKEIDPE